MPFANNIVLVDESRDRPDMRGFMGSLHTLEKEMRFGKQFCCMEFKGKRVPMSVQEQVLEGKVNQLLL